MSLNSFQFVIFFIIVFGILLFLQMVRRGGNTRVDNVAARAQIVVMLLASLVFMAFADIRFLVCIGILTCVSYFCAVFWERYHKRIFIIGGVSLSLGMLGYFKYCNFFVGGFAGFLGVNDISFNIMLPLGISFYTFSAISYLIDVKREKYPAEKNLIDYALYMTFFPKVTSGPIVRGDEFLPYLKSYQGIKADNFSHGIQMFMLGFFKKVVLADHLGVFVNEIFAAPAAFHSATVALGVFSYSLQVYFDFAGYSDMAIGISKILGFDFAPNFNLPLVAGSVSEYWRRWHISLGTWFRDYLYYPLSIGPAVKIRKKLLDMGVKRKLTGSIASAAVLLVVWMATGLWHGAQMTFVLWGVIQFVFVFYDQNHRTSQKPSRARGFLNWLFTFLVIMLCKVIFRADDITAALDVYRSMFLWHDGIVHLYSWTFVATVLLAVGTLAAYIRSGRLGEKEVNSFYPLLDLRRLIPLTVFFVFCGLTLILGYYGDTVFIYEKF